MAEPIETRRGERPTRGFDVLRQKNFSFYLTARLLSTVAMQMLNVAVGWQVYAMTGDVLDLGLIGLAQFAPFVALVLIAGQVADRYNRRRIVTLCYALQLSCALLFFAFTVMGLKTVWPVFVILVLVGTARAFHMPTSQAMLINLVPAESFGNAVALSSSTFHVAVITGPVLGGVLYLAGPEVVYAVVAALLVVAVSFMMNVKLSKPPQAGRDPASWHGVLEGLRFVWTRPVVLGAISLDLFAVLFGGATALLPAYARDVLDIGPTGLGLLRMAPAIGAACTSVLLAFRPLSRQVGRWMFGGVAVYGVATIVFGGSHSPLLSFSALVIMGAGDMVSVYIRHILVQFETPDAIRGRVSAVNAVFIGASNELGEFESGITARWFGLVPAVVLGGVATLIVTGTWMSLFPVLRRMNRFPHGEGADPAKPAG